jgi:hypothetical protein
MKKLTVIVVFATIAAGYGHAQVISSAAPSPTCAEGELWLTGKVGAVTTSTGLRIPPSARLDEGVTFCIQGVLVRAEEALFSERDGQRVFTLNGRVTLTVPR